MKSLLDAILSYAATVALIVLAATLALSYFTFALIVCIAYMPVVLVAAWRGDVRWVKGVEGG